MTQQQAISKATEMARQWANENECNWTEKVLLVSGDTLHLTSTPNGRITRRVTPGWNREGNYYYSSRIVCMV